MSVWRRTVQRRSARAAFGLVLAGLIPATALAGPGDHIKAGNAVITPTVGLGYEHRTNAYRHESNPLPVDQVLVTPNLEIISEGADVDFSLSGSSQLRYTLVTGADRRQNLDRFNDFGVNADLNLLKKQSLGFHVSEAATLRNFITQAGMADSPFNTQFRNDLLGEAVIRVGAPIEIKPGFSWAFDDYRVPTSGTQTGLRNFNRRNTYVPQLHGKWTFFPRTALVADATYEMFRWEENWVVSRSDAPGRPSLGEFLALPNSNHLKLTSGLRGRFTERLVLIATAGYGFALYDEEALCASAPDASECDPVVNGVDVKGLPGLLVFMQAKYDLGPGRALKLGYRKDFLDSWFTNYLAFNQVFASVDLRFGPRIGTIAEFSTRIEDYAGEVSRNDTVLQAKLDVSYAAQDWMTFGAGVWWVERISPIARDVEYDDFNIHVKASFSY